MKSVPAAKDTLLTVNPGKNVFLRLSDYIHMRILWHDITINHQEDIAYWSHLTGLHIDNWISLLQLADTLYIRKLHHVSWPDGISKTDAQKMRKMIFVAVAEHSRLKNVYCPMGSAFIKKAVSEFRQAITQQSTHKWILYSAHDATILAVMSMLGAPMNHIPPYASDLNFSLFAANPVPIVTIRLNGKPVYVTGCGGYQCSIDQLTALRC